MSLCKQRQVNNITWTSAQHAPHIGYLSSRIAAWAQSRERPERPCITSWL